MCVITGRMIQCKAVGIATRKPKGEQLDQANPVRNDETGLWQCPFCQKNDFPELSEVRDTILLVHHNHNVINLVPPPQKNNIL